MSTGTTDQVQPPNPDTASPAAQGWAARDGHAWHQGNFRHRSRAARTGRGRLALWCTHKVANHDRIGVQ